MNDLSSFRQACVSILVGLVIIVTLHGCGGSGGGEAGSGRGSLAFKLSLADSAARPTLASNSERELAELACDTQLIETIEAEVLHNGQIVAEGGPWNCTDHQGTIDGVPAGAGLKLVVYAMNEDQKAVFKGSIDGLSVTGGKATDAGTILLERLTNRPPVLNPIGNRIVNENESLTINISASDLDGDNLTFTAALLKNGERTSLPPGAVLNATGNMTAQFQWTPGLQASDNYQILFTVTDDGFVVMDDSTHKPEPLNDSEPINIAVGDVPIPPELAPIGNKIITVGDLLQFDITATDPDEVGDLPFYADKMPANAVLTPIGYQSGCNCWTATFKWQTVNNLELEQDDTGSYPVTFRVADSSKQEDSEQIQIQVNPLTCAGIGNLTETEGEELPNYLIVNKIQIVSSKYTYGNEENFLGLLIADFNEDGNNEIIIDYSRSGYDYTPASIYFPPDDFGAGPREVRVTAFCYSPHGSLSLMAYNSTGGPIGTTVNYTADVNNSEKQTLKFTGNNIQKIDLIGDYIAIADICYRK
jgi:hypothetical protein